MFPLFIFFKDVLVEKFHVEIIMVDMISEQQFKQLTRSVFANDKFVKLMQDVTIRRMFSLLFGNKTFGTLGVSE